MSAAPNGSPRMSRTLRNWLIAAGIFAVLNMVGLLALWLFLHWRRVPDAAAESTKIVVTNETPVVSAPPGFPLRDPKAKANEIDLSMHYNAILNKNWHDVPGNDLAELPTGLQTFAGTEFDVRGLIGVARRSQRNPPEVLGIPVDQTCRRIHFLQAANGARDTLKGRVIGKYVVHYANGEAKEVPLISKVNIGDWWVPVTDDELEVPVAWTGENAKSRTKGQKVRLMKYTWENPLPKERISTIDVVAEFPGPAPFLVAMTLE